MEAQKQNFDMNTTRKSLRYDDPLVIGAGALVLGFALGSGRLGWLGRGTGRLASSLGTMALNYFYQSLQQHNPELFTPRSRVTH